MGALMAIAGEARKVDPTPADDQMRRPVSIALASLLVAVLVAPVAQAATRRYDFQDFHGSEDFLPGHIVAIHIAVFYKSKHGRYTPRQAMYDSLVPYSCNPPVSGTGAVGTGSNIYGTNDYNLIKLRKGSFTYSSSSEITTDDGTSVGFISASATGKVITKQRKGQKLRVDGSVSVLDYEYPTLGDHNCTSGGPVPYSATPCRRVDQISQPSYIKPSLPYCSLGPV
jgi:hypothetical protein